MSAVTRAEFRSFHADREAFFFHIRLGVIGCRHFKGFSSIADTSLAIPRILWQSGLFAVREISKIQSSRLSALCICAKLGIFRQNKQSVVACARVQILGKAELHAGAEHSAGLISS